MLYKNIGSKSIALILLSLASICLYTEISLADVNIDLSDEGYHLSRFSFPNEVSATLMRDHLYISHLFKMLDSRISLLRLSNIFFLVISCGFFCHGFFSYFFNNSSKSSNGFVITLILISSAIIIQLPSLWIERVPAYNNATSYISLTTIGIFLRSLNPSFSRISIPYFFIGFLTTFCFFIKPPSYIVLIAFIYIINLLFFKRIKQKFIYFLLGSLCCFILHFTIMEGFADYINSTKLGLSFASFSGHSEYKFLILNYLEQLFVTIKFSITYNKALYFYFILTVFLIRKIISPKSLLLVFIIFLFLISFRHFFLGDNNGGLSLYWYQWRFYAAQFFFSFLFIIILFYKSKLSLAHIFNPKITICLISLLMPFFLSIGTNNIIMFNMNFYSIISISCFVFILSYFYDLYNKSIKQSYFPLLLLLFCIGPFYSHFNGRLNSSFYGLLTKSYSYDSKHPIKLNNETIYVNHELKSFHHSFSTIFKENKSNLKYLLNFTGSPGFNFFSNLPHPIQPWTLIRSNEFTLSNIDNAIFSASAILSNSSCKKTSDELNKYFPKWRESHPIKKSLTLKKQDQNLIYEIYFPRTETL